LSAETFAKALIEGLLASKVAVVAGVPDGLLAPSISRLQELDHPKYVECAREEECIGVAAGVVMTGKRSLVLCQNAGLLNGIGAFATLAVRYRLPMVLVVANRGGIGDANAYDIEKFETFSRAVPHIAHMHTCVLNQFTPQLVTDAFVWAYAGHRPIVLAVEKGTG
jgi:sulfopyruvate decarboxylase TPP-binding subunit